MTADELRQLIAGGERDTLEFKPSTGQRSRAMETLCAMLNSCGGPVRGMIGQGMGVNALEEFGRCAAFATDGGEIDDVGRRDTTCGTFAR